MRFVERSVQLLYNIKVITELKAIHNMGSCSAGKLAVVQHQSYYRIESNSQLLRMRITQTVSCTTSKLLQNWKQFTTVGCNLFQSKLLYNIKVITELKAIHNIGMQGFPEYSVVQHQSYYRIESNSQLSVQEIVERMSCTTSKLLQNWKQFTTGTWRALNQGMLYNIKVITELKAIHNSGSHSYLSTIVVQHQSYYRIESNSQPEMNFV